MTAEQRDVRRVLATGAQGDFPERFRATWRTVREAIATGISQPRTVYTREGTFCGRCGSPVAVIDSGCW